MNQPDEASIHVHDRQLKQLAIAAQQHPPKSRERQPALAQSSQGLLTAYCRPQ